MGILGKICFLSNVWFFQRYLVLLEMVKWSHMELFQFQMLKN